MSEREMFELTSPQKSIWMMEQFYKGTNINNICATLIINTVFEYGGEEEILETIRFYGKDVVKEVLSGIADERKAESRNENMKKYLD